MIQLTSKGHYQNARGSEATPDAWRAQGTWIAFRGQRLFVTSHGSGPWIVLLHAFPTASYDYARITPLLRARYRLIMFDYPGFGFSTKPQHYPYSLLTYADALEAVMRHFGITRTFAVAHDIGASVLLEVLRRGTLNITRLVLLNTSIVPQPRVHQSLYVARRILLHPVLGPLIGQLRLIQRPVLARMLNALFARTLTQQELRNFWALVHTGDGPRIYHRLVTYMDERDQYEQVWLAALRHHSAPLALVWGEADPIATPAVADAIARLRPDAVITRLADIGHYPHWDAPEATARAIDAAFGSA